jgi:uncharacterized cysteine cluster protein YcgN (CxxCxxCC family)
MHDILDYCYFLDLRRTCCKHCPLMPLMKKVAECVSATGMILDIHLLPQTSSYRLVLLILLMIKSIEKLV